MRQGFVEHFKNLNPKPKRIEKHGHIEPQDLYHERVKIPNKFKEHIYRDNIVEMRVHFVADVIPISLALAPNLLHHNNVGVTYARTSNFKMEPTRFVPLYFVAMP